MKEMTIFEKAIALHDNRIESLIKYNDYGLYISKCLIKYYKRYCKKYPTRVFYNQNLKYYKSSYGRHKQALKDLSEMQDLLNEIEIKYLEIIKDLEKLDD